MEKLKTRISRILTTLLLSVAMLITAIPALPGYVYAGTADTTLSIKMVDEEGQPVEGVAPLFTAYNATYDSEFSGLSVPVDKPGTDDPENWSVTDENGEVSFDLTAEDTPFVAYEENNYATIYYMLSCNSDDYECTEPVKIELAADTNYETYEETLYVSKVNGTDYNGGPISLTVKSTAEPVVKPSSVQIFIDEDSYEEGSDFRFQPASGGKYMWIAMDTATGEDLAGNVTADDFQLKTRLVEETEFVNAEVGTLSVEDLEDGSVRVTADLPDNTESSDRVWVIEYKHSNPTTQYESCNDATITQITAFDVNAPYEASDFTYGEQAYSTASNVDEWAVYPGNDHDYMVPGTKNVVTGFSKSGEKKLRAGNTDLIIPAKDPEGNKVQGIANGAFNANTNTAIKESGNKLTSLTLPGGVTTTENVEDINAAWGEKGYLGKHGAITEIGDFTIGTNAFRYNNFTELNLPEGVLSLQTYAFANCTKLTKVQFPSTLMIISSYAFGSCTSLSEADFAPETDVRLSIRQGAFLMSAMSEVKLPKDTLQVYDQAFRKKSGTVSLEVPGRESSFIASSSYHTVTYTEVSKQTEAKEATCEEDGNAAGYKCLACGKVFSDEAMTKELENGVIPALGHDWEFTELTKEPTADEDGEALYTCKNDASHTKKEAVKFAWEAADFTFEGNTVTGLSESGYTKLNWNTDLALPEANLDGTAVTAVGNNAFQSSQAGKADCKKITNVTFPASITKIGNMAFGTCSIENLVLPDTITEVGTAAFQSNYGMKTVKISKGMTVIPQGFITTNAVSMNAEEGVHDIIIPEGITEIGASAFNGQHVKNLTLPSTLTSIGRMAFQNHQISELEIPAGVKEISQDAFHFTQEGPERTLSKLTLHEGLTTIGSRAFGGSSLKVVEIPESVTSIHKDAFKARSLSNPDPKVVCLIKSSSPLVGSADGSCHTFAVSYKVTFVNSEDDADDVVAWTDKDGKVAKFPAAKNKDHYRVFEGWFDAAEEGNEVSADAVFDADATVYAQWRDASAEEKVGVIADELPTNVTVEDKEAVEAAREAYEALSDEEKAALPETVELKIQAAEAKLSAAEADENAAAAKEEAQKAKDDAAAAQEQADKAKEEAQKAKDDAAAAQEQADKAKDDAAAAQEEAQKAKDDAAAAQEEAQKAKEEAQKAKEEAAAAQEQADKAKEEAAAAQAKSTLAATVVDAATSGVTKAKYTKETYNNFTEALDSAKAAMAKADATTEELNNASAALTAAKDALVLKTKNTLTVKAKTVTLKASALKKKAQNVAVKKAFTVSKPVGKVTYKKTSGNSKIKVASSGKITVAKGLKKGTYKVVVAVKAAGNDNTLPLTKKVTVKIVVK